jgi:hypothetical protein
VYVQHRLKERSKEVNELLVKKAYFYVCGDAANMAREVNAILGQIIAEERGISEAKAEEIVKNMRAANQYQVRRFPPAVRRQWHPCHYVANNILLIHGAGGRLVLKKDADERAPITTGLPCAAHA